MEELKEFLDDMKKEIGSVRNDVAAKFASDVLNKEKSSHKVGGPADGGVKAGGGTGVGKEVIKKIEDDIKEMKTKFEKQFDAIKTQQSLMGGQVASSGGEGGSGGGNAAATAELMNMMRKIEDQNTNHLKRMT